VKLAWDEDVTRVKEERGLKPVCGDVCLFICFESHEQFFSITGDRAANLDLCLALTAFRSDGSFTFHTYCDTGLLFFMSYPKDP
jgi:hypothetical protein